MKRYICLVILPGHKTAFFQKKIFFCAFQSNIEAEIFNGTATTHLINFTNFSYGDFQK